MAHLPKNQSGVGSPDAQTTKGSFGTRFGVVVSIIGVTWAYVSLFAGPFAGQIPAVEPTLGTPFWTALLFTFLWKIWGKKGTVGFLVGLLAGIGVFGLAFGVTYLVRVQDNEAQVASMNQGLPRMISDEIRLDSISRDGNNLIYDLTVIGLSADEIDTQEYSEETRASMTQRLCEDAEVRASMSSGIKFVYDIEDESGAKIAKLVFDNSDCD